MRKELEGMRPKTLTGAAGRRSIMLAPAPAAAFFSASSASVAQGPPAVRPTGLISRFPNQPGTWIA